MQKFVNSLQAVADSPNSIAARQTMLSEARSLVDRLKSYDSSLRSLDSQVNATITSEADSITSLARGIADLNKQIANGSTSSGQAPNDLLDQRDRLHRRAVDARERQRGQDRRQPGERVHRQRPAAGGGQRSGTRGRDFRSIRSDAQAPRGAIERRHYRYHHLDLGRHPRWRAQLPFGDARSGAQLDRPNQRGARRCDERPAPRRHGSQRRPGRRFLCRRWRRRAASCQQRRHLHCHRHAHRHGRVDQ